MTELQTLKSAFSAQSKLVATYENAMNLVGSDWDGHPVFDEIDERGLTEKDAEFWLIVNETIDTWYS